MEFILPSALSFIIGERAEMATVTAFMGIMPAQVHISTRSFALASSACASLPGRADSIFVTASTFISPRNNSISPITIIMVISEKNTAERSRRYIFMFLLTNSVSFPIYFSSSAVLPTAFRKTSSIFPCITSKPLIMGFTFSMAGSASTVDLTLNDTP